MKYLLARIYEILLEHRQGIKEYDLIQQLKDEALIPGDLSESLSLFQTHFTLFHLLYQLRLKLREEGRFDLNIHCLDIRLTLPRHAHTGTDQPHPIDPLEAYYLDLKNAEGMTAEKVQEMIKNFLSGVCSPEERQKAYETLGLQPKASARQIKSRYRELAKQHHPDLGGDGETFVRISRAAELLLQSNS